MRGIRNYVGVDVDEVVASLHEPWNRWINVRFGVNRDPKGGFSSWDEPTEKYGQEVYDFLTPSIYEADIVTPIPGTLEAVEAIRSAGHTVFFISSCPGLGDMPKAKRSWLIRHGYLEERTSHAFVPTSDKSRAPVHILIDDGFHNVQTFRGVGLLVNAPHNAKDPWRGVRIDHLAEALPFIGF